MALLPADAPRWQVQNQPAPRADHLHPCGCRLSRGASFTVARATARCSPALTVCRRGSVDARSLGVVDAQGRIFVLAVEPMAPGGSPIAANTEMLRLRERCQQISLNCVRSANGDTSARGA
jgi:hypothetical protein